ncbi:nucleolar protein 58 [Bradysia coprophila]|uniref:nucleolar protein 58 n=1 Tax=Bradysia coprophila TaxID=38358 RepID=UPI00187D70AA|nr:nucleolar protein 58 [Bradysia coprophila]
MFVLYETPAGYAIFKVLDESKVSQVDNLYLEFETPEKANQIVKLKHFQKFEDTTEALAAATAAVEGKLCKTLKKTLKKLVSEDIQNELLVADAKLGSAIKDKLELKCVANSGVQELMRCIRSQSESLLAGLPKKEMTAMALGLAHSLSRYKLKFSPDKIDTMIVQAQCLLDDLDKELNNYLMRAREWYGWHFPELGKIITDNIAFIKTIKLVGTRENMVNTDLSDILPEDVEEKVKEAAEISMGTEISDDDIFNIQNLCDEILAINDYRVHLSDYLKSRMLAMAPNLTVLVGETIGARLIAHSGSLTNLAKHPASTVQILGAEKALFRALKTKKDTPKYGLIYHAQLVGQASQKNKGKMSRSLAAKASLAIRVDAFGDDGSFDMGTEHKVKLEARLRLLEEGNLRRISGTAKAKSKFEKYHVKTEVKPYPTEADSTLPSTSKKRKHSEIETPKKLIEELPDADTEPKSEKKKKKIKKEKDPEDDAETPMKKIKTEEAEEVTSEKKKKKKKDWDAEEAGPSEAVATPSSEKKKKRQHQPAEEEEEAAPADVSMPTSEKKKKKKKKTADEDN